MKKWIWLFYAGLVFTEIALADTYVVRPDGSGDFPTIQAAINAVSDGDTIELTNGTFTGDGNRDINYLGKAITVRSQSGNPDSCVIDCQGSEANSHRGFYFHSGEGAESLLEGVTITNGRTSEDGAGVYCANSSPTFTNCSISGNSITHAGGGYGGGVYCIDSSPIFVNCIFGYNLIGNTSTGCGGGVACENSSSTFLNCAISANRASGVEAWGGGICAVNSSLIFVNCTISGNEGSGYGPSGGGGVYCSGVSLVFTNCTIRGNSIESSESGASGGGVYCYCQDSATFTNCTICENSAQHYGGGVDGRGTFTSCVLWGNVPDQITPPGDAYVTYSDVQGGWSGEGNISADPRFRNSENGDYHLMWTNCGNPFDSPCIDAGDPSIEDDSLDCDFGLGTTLCDIGAYGGNAVPGSGVSYPDNPIMPVGFTLFQNYPNPFNPTTAIRYDVKQAGQVRLTIFSLLGREVARLVDGRQLAGSYTVSWDAADLPSGIYLCRMEAPGFVQTRKLVLIK